MLGLRMSGVGSQTAMKGQTAKLTEANRRCSQLMGGRCYSSELLLPKTPLALKRQGHRPDLFVVRTSCRGLVRAMWKGRLRQGTEQTLHRKQAKHWNGPPNNRTTRGWSPGRCSPVIPPTVAQLLRVCTAPSLVSSRVKGWASPKGARTHPSPPAAIGR